MRMSLISKSLKSVCKKFSNSQFKVAQSDFLIFDKQFDKIINVLKIPVCDFIVIPINIRQLFCSHMVLLCVIQNTAYYFDPDGDECPPGLTQYVISTFSISNFVTKKGIKNEKFECALSCLKGLISILNNGTI